MLIQMTTEDVANAMISSIDELSMENRSTYARSIREKNLCGKVLAICDLEELKNELKMSFGDWLLFKAWITIKKEEKLLYRQEPSRSSFSKNKQSETIKSHSTSLSKIPEIRTTEPLDSQNHIATSQPEPSYEVSNETKIDQEVLLDEDLFKGSENCQLYDENDEEDDEDENLLNPNKCNFIQSICFRLIFLLKNLKKLI